MPKAITLFSGGGGVDLALEALGFQVVEAVEKNPKIAQTFALNFPETELKIQDVCEWKSNKQVDLLHLSPPCTNFSQAKIGKKTTDTDSNWLPTVLAYIRENKPKQITLENVPSYRKFECLRSFLLELVSLGYEVRESKVFFANYGVPQTRVRYLVYAQLNKIPKLVDFTLTYKNQRKICWFEAIEDLLSNCEETNLTPKQNEALGDRQTGTFLIQRGGYFDKLPRLIDRNHLAPTLRASWGDSGDYENTSKKGRSQVLTLWYKQKAWNVTIAMLIRLASFPDEYVFCDNNLAHACRILGNAVPPKGYFNWFKEIST